jgi:predicted phage gp36 major capsid-like protein
VVKVAASVLQHKMETDEMMEVVAEQERKTEEYLNKATELRDRCRRIVDKAREEAKKLRQEAIRPRNINFDSPTDHQPLATPKDNMEMAAELLAKNDEESTSATSTHSSLQQCSNGVRRILRADWSPT